MKNHSKRTARILTLCLTLVLLVSALPLASFAAGFGPRANVWAGFYNNRDAKVNDWKYLEHMFWVSRINGKKDTVITVKDAEEPILIGDSLYDFAGFSSFNRENSALVTNGATKFPIPAFPVKTSSITAFCYFLNLWYKKIRPFTIK